MTKSKIVATALLVAGMIVVAAATVLPNRLPTALFWTEEQAIEQATAASRLHQTTHESAHLEVSNKSSEADKRQARQEVEAAKARYDASDSELDRAQFWRRTLPRILRWVGGGICMLGVLVYLSASGMRD